MPTEDQELGFATFIDEAPIPWHSKKQSRIENSVFGSEFIATRTALKTVQGIRYKIRMMGVPLNTPVYIHGDNMSVIHKPESTLKKKPKSATFIEVGGTRNLVNMDYLCEGTD